MMSSNFSSPCWVARRFCLIALILLLSTASLLAQTTVGTGSLVGTVTDPSGAVVSVAKVTITNIATGQATALTTNPAGAYNSGSVAPGHVKLQLSCKGFIPVIQLVTV